MGRMGASLVEPRLLEVTVPVVLGVTNPTPPPK